MFDMGCGRSDFIFFPQLPAGEASSPIVCAERGGQFFLGKRERR
jgi:hypothetical protein